MHLKGLFACLAYLLLPTGLYSTANFVAPAGDTILSPEIKCISVLPNGQVMLTWTNPPDPNNKFNSYHIYFSASPAGPFAPVDSIFNYTATSWTHTTVNANISPFYYYMQSRSGPAGDAYAPPGNTLSTMFLKVLNPGTGTANLSWNALSAPLPGGSDAFYNIYREYPAGTWTLLGQTSSLSYKDTVRLCGAVLNYRVETGNSQAGCVSVSSVAGGAFKDILPPAIPLTDSVSVDSASGKAFIGWQKSNSPDTKGYIVYKLINNAWTAVDTVFGSGNTGYLYAGSSASSSAEEFRIAAFDSCKNVSPMGGVHKAMYLQLGTDNCSASNTLTWNAYEGWTVGEYKIYVSINGSPFAYLASASSPGYVHAGLDPSTRYCYFVRASGSLVQASSSSSLACINTTIPVKPSFAYLNTATVTSPSSVLVKCMFDPAATARSVRFMRSGSPAGPFITLATVDPAGAKSVSFVDEGVNTASASYYYRAVIQDSCGADAATSNNARTILLSVTANGDFTNTLNWNHYEMWGGWVNSYKIFRAVDGVFDPAAVAVVPGGTNTFTDDVSPFYDFKGFFSYYVEAVEGAGNMYNVMDSSRSNIAEAVQDHAVFVPNAFAPAGKNKIFAPRGAFLDKTEYTLYVFDRYGGLVFESSSYDTGWDGHINGKLAPQGAYVYLLKYKSSKGEALEKKGTVMLIR